MIRSIVFPPDATEELYKRLTEAGSGAELRLIPRASKDGTGITFYLDVRSAETLSLSEEDCDEPVNSSHVCPGPLCP